MLGDIVAEWLAFLVPAVAVAFGWGTLFADKMVAVRMLDFLFAFSLGIVFQYFAIPPMRGLAPWPGIVATIKADALLLASWQVGMYDMAFFQWFWLPHARSARRPLAQRFQVRHRFPGTATATDVMPRGCGV